jgi:hypothetical protein
MEQKVEAKPINKKTLYIGSAVAVSAGMGVIKLVATVINHTVAIVLEHLV